MLNALPDTHHCCIGRCHPLSMPADNVLASRTSHYQDLPRRILKHQPCGADLSKVYRTERVSAEAILSPKSCSAGISFLGIRLGCIAIGSAIAPSGQDYCRSSVSRNVTRTQVLLEGELEDACSTVDLLGLWKELGRFLFTCCLEVALHMQGYGRIALRCNAPDEHAMAVRALRDCQRYETSKRTTISTVVLRPGEVRHFRYSATSRTLRQQYPLCCHLQTYGFPHLPANSYR